MTQQLGLGQKQIAAAMGVSVARVSQIEHGEIASFEVIARYVEASAAGRTWLPISVTAPPTPRRRQSQARGGTGDVTGARCHSVGNREAIQASPLARRWSLAWNAGPDPTGPAIRRRRPSREVKTYVQRT